MGATAWTRRPRESVLSEKRRGSRQRSGGHFRKQARELLWRRKNRQEQRNQGRSGRGECHERGTQETHLQAGQSRSLVAVARVIQQSGGDRG